MDISDLTKNLVGKKLLWAGTDPQNGSIYFLFEGNQGISLEDVKEVVDAKATMQSLLDENLFTAENFVALKKIVGDSKNGNVPGVTQAPSAETGKPTS